MTTTRIIGFSKAVSAGWLRVLDRLHPLKTLFRDGDSGLIVSGQRRQQLGQDTPPEPEAEPDPEPEEE